MKPITRLTLCWIVLPAIAAHANDQPPPPATSTDQVLALAAEDALCAAYFRDPSAVLNNPVLAVIAEQSDFDLASFGEAWAETFSGPNMIAVRATVLRPDGIGLSFASRTSLPREELFERIETRLGAALATATSGAVALQVGRDGELATLRLSKPFVPVALYLGVRDGVVYGDTRRHTVRDFVNAAGSHTPSARLVDADDFNRLPESAELRAGRVDMLVHVNARPLMVLARAHMAPEAPGLFEALELDNFETATLTAHWSGPEASFGLAIGVGDEEAKLARLIAPVNGQSDAASILPQDTLVMLSGSMTSASDAVDSICRIFEGIAPEVVEEYRSELAQVTTEFGFDPQADFLGNMVDEWAVGLDVDQEGSPKFMLLVKLADNEAFIGHLRNLVTAYRLPIDTQVYEGVEILTRADGASPAVSLAVYEDRLLVAGAPETIAHAIDAHTAGQTLDKLAAFKQVARKLGTSNSRLAFVNLTRVAKLALTKINEEDAQGMEVFAQEVLHSLLDREAGVGIATRKQPGVLSTRAVFNETSTAAAGNLAMQSLAASLAQARRQARRAVSMANIKGILTCCLIHANDNMGAFPDTLAQLAEQGQVTPQVFCSPYDGSGPQTIEEIATESFYLYKAGLNNKTLKDPANTVVLAEQWHGEDGIAIGFADGHVEWVTEPRAGQLLAQMR